MLQVTFPNSPPCGLRACEEMNSIFGCTAEVSISPGLTAVYVSVFRAKHLGFRQWNVY